MKSAKMEKQLLLLRHLPNQNSWSSMFLPLPDPGATLLTVVLDLATSWKRASKNSHCMVVVPSALTIPH